eukprot:CAMPEP_0171287312 /NCGR_PEP_ID=MMETSP0790-20130122/69481_1 /TAXON_ID=2925 /ORGANISM="Alexandrium catenella, Strain OF101" /LENGTH=333 /DNA_ID=CAMNT_0011756819 /DNA_START=134 /DNA_END=1135 /DNA_ORIENTATION=+
MAEFGPQPSVTEEDMAAEQAKIQAQQGRTRRAGVAAESVDKETIKDYKKPVYPKDEETMARLRKTLKENDKMQVLCGHLDGEPLNDVINAFYTKEVKAGEDIIRQGEEGDCLYIINDGSVDIFVARPGPDGKIADGDRGQKVVTFSGGALFGELALMYNSPRAATVVAASDKVLLWVLAAQDFKMLLAQSSQAQYAKYEGWLSEVELLKALNHFELSKLADILESEVYDAGEEIIKQGDPGSKFYLLEEGEAAAVIAGDDGEKEVKKYVKQGDYFGEIALLTEEPRKATVRATGGGCSVVSLSKADFTSLLGPIADILKNDVDKYPQYADFLK